MEYKHHSLTNSPASSPTYSTRSFMKTAVSTSKRLKDLETRQEEIERLILIERSKAVIKLSEKDIRTFYETAL